MEKGYERLGKVNSMPVLEIERFMGRLQRGNRVQVPRLIRWRHKLEPGEVLYVEVYDREQYRRQKFYVRLSRDGRFTIPKVVAEASGAEAGSLLEITLFHLQDE